MSLRVSEAWLRARQSAANDPGTPPVKSLSLELIYPPSVNNLFSNSSRGGRFVSPRYKAWRAQAGGQALEQAPGSIEGAYEMRVIATRPDRRTRDVEGLAKALSDLLVTLGIVRDDSDCQSITLEWADERPRRDATVRIILTTTRYRGLQP